MRVLQKNLVFVVGLSQRLSDPEILKRQDYFGKYGKILKVVINSNTAYAGSQGPSCSAYVTYSKMEEALRAIQSVNNVYIDGRTLKASLGTTKYCSTYLKNQQCQKIDCMYLHEIAEDQLSFTKEDMQAGKHQELEQKLIDQMMQKEREYSPVITAGSEIETERNPSQTQKISASSSSTIQQSNKENVLCSNIQISSEASFSKLHTPAVDKTSIIKTSPAKKATKSSPWHLPKQNDEEIYPDHDHSCNISESSSTTTTPPPVSHVGTESDNRLKSFPCEELTKENAEGHVRQADFTAEDKLGSLDNVTSDPQGDTLARAAESLFISKPPDATDHQGPSSRYSHQVKAFPGFESSCLTYSGNLFDSSSSTSMWMPHTNAQPLADAMPIKSSNDWEAAFGFHKAKTTDIAVGTETDCGDDDLGFDPWLECNKGLADLLEKENASSLPMKTTQQSLRSFSANQNFSTSHLQPLMNSSLHHQSMPQLKSNVYLNGLSSPHGSGLSPNSVSQHYRRQKNNFDLPKENVDQNYEIKGLSEWQNGLRALLPSVNINFAVDSSGQNSQLPHPVNQNSRVLGFGETSFVSQTASSSGDNISMFPVGSNDWSVASSSQSTFPTNNADTHSLLNNGFGLRHATNETFALAPPPGLSSAPFNKDPAIISSHSQIPTPYRPQSVQEETPHWMKSLQTLTENDSSMNLTASSSRYINKTETTQNSFTPWLSYPNPEIQTSGNLSQPPPGFQTRLPAYANSKSDFTMCHNLLENQS
ncbi:unnamed protein product [Clavelina lepadiformis]|uniref:RRM domain-containing protein n=1 Tax=Clavelina lepadiformis TaxID=159417 RepID=A0ABP0GYK8_CLALP